jgi:hypothetical protein
MEKAERIFTEFERKQKRTKEKKKYSNVLKQLGLTQKVVAEPLIDNIVFCVVELEELRMIISKDGHEEEYQNGKEQWGKKETTASKQYAKIGKLHTDLLKRLKDFIPDNSGKKDELEKFRDKYKK